MWWCRFKTFPGQERGNAVYTSHIAVVEFMEALGTWVKEFLLKLLHQASCFSIMADECTDVATIEGCQCSVAGRKRAHQRSIFWR